VTFLIFALLSGIFFGIYCHVLVLVPATLATAATYSAVAWCDGQGASSLASLIMVSSVALQGGYMIGLTSRDLLGPLFDRGNGSSSKGIKS
jgi:hypothetical protein